MKIDFDFKEFKKYLLSALFIFIGVAFLFTLYTSKLDKISQARNFLEEIENKSFDLRQNLTTKYRSANKDIVILGIDDSTYEYVIENYGEWPMPRYLYADAINYIEKQNPKLIAFDLLFVKSFKNSFNSDEKLTQLFRDYKNLYTSMNFDDMETKYRTPLPIDDKLKVNVDNKLNADIMTLPNYRPILNSIVEATPNIGHINIQRSADGVIRDFSPFVVYQDKYYPHLALLVAQNLMGTKTKDFAINKDYTLQFDEKTYPITKQGTMFLNWYGDSNVYEEIPFVDVIQNIEAEKRGKISPNKISFKDKIVYVGTTAPNLNDIKTVPTEKNLPGVITHITFIDNMLQNQFIQRVSFEWDFITTLFLCLFLGLIMLKVEYSKINYKYMVPINFSVLIGTLIIYYIFATYYLMAHLNLWVAIVMPTIGIIITFTAVYLIRYFFKSKDYEYTYRLATTDGLTELYNHRYFQEQMLANIESCKKSGKKFSLILTDIDFFKKFNDQYGHQAGDAVVRQVAKTLKKNVKKTDWVCRYGGEEMSVILRNADNKAAMDVAQRLCEAVANTVFKLSPTLDSHVTISLGVATYPDNGSTPTELIEYSDKGLYVAKENGRNQVGVVKN